ncbi:MAG: GlsB/YeaQ/YmgE family stress response membrane protein [Phormidesmis sp.]
MGILAWVVLGLLAGAIARAIYPGHQGLGILGTMVLGIVGALVGGFLYSLIGGTGGAALSIGGVVVAVLGAIITLFIYYAVTKRTA